MSDLRFERFSDPALLTRVMEGEAVPRVGWAIRFNGDVFCDGVQIGRSGKYVLSRDRSTPYAEIAFEAVDSGPAGSPPSGGVVRLHPHTESDDG
jgi:hypothetical protein